MSAKPATNRAARVNHSVRSTWTNPSCVVPEDLGPDLGQEHQQHGETAEHDERRDERAAAAAGERVGRRAGGVVR